MEIPKMLKGEKPDKHYMLRKLDGTLTTTIEERQERWAEWIKNCFQCTKEKEPPDINHITEASWEKLKLPKP